MSKTVAQTKEGLVVMECSCEVGCTERRCQERCRKRVEPEEREFLLEELKLICIGAFVGDYYMGV